MSTSHYLGAAAEQGPPGRSGLFSVPRASSKMSSSVHPSLPTSGAFAYAAAPSTLMPAGYGPEVPVRFGLAVGVADCALAARMPSGVTEHHRRDLPQLP